MSSSQNVTAPKPQIDRAVNKFTLEDDILVFSGTSRAHYEHYRVGDQFEGLGYLSTSIRIKDAESFYARTAAAGKEPLMMRILVPKGTKGLFVGENTAYPVYQGEFLLSHGLFYRVIAKSENEMTIEVLA